MDHNTETKKPRKSGSKTILPDLNKYHIPHEIKIEAELIFQQMNKRGVARGWERVGLLFYCSYHAYNKKLIRKDPYILGNEIFQMTKKQVKKALNTNVELQTGYEPQVDFGNAVDYINEYGTRLGLSSEIIENIKNFGNYILDKYPCMRYRPKLTLAASLISYYSETTNQQLFSYEVFYQIVGKFEMTVNKLCTEIRYLEQKYWDYEKISNL